MAVPVGYTCVLDNMLPEGIPGTGTVVLISLLHPEGKGRKATFGGAAFSTWLSSDDEHVPAEHPEARVGETFQVGDQTWRLDSIDPGKASNRPGRFHATITRVA